MDGAATIFILWRGTGQIPHAKCVEPERRCAHNHYDAYEVDLRAAHDEFETLYVMESSIECEGLTSIAE